MRGENAPLLSVRVENAFGIHHCKSTEVCHTSHHAPPWLTSRVREASDALVSTHIHISCPATYDETLSSSSPLYQPSPGELGMMPLVASRQAPEFMDNSTAVSPGRSRQATTIQNLINGGLIMEWIPSQRRERIQACFKLAKLLI